MFVKSKKYLTSPCYCLTLREAAASHIDLYFHRYLDSLNHTGSPDLHFVSSTRGSDIDHVWIRDNSFVVSTSHVTSVNAADVVALCISTRAIRARTTGEKQGSHDLPKTRTHHTSCAQRLLEDTLNKV